MRYSQEKRKFGRWTCAAVAALALAVGSCAEGAKAPAMPSEGRPVAAAPARPAAKDLTPDQRKQAYAYLRRAEHHYSEKRYAEAVANYRQLLDEFGESSLADDAQFWIGRIQYEQGAYARSVQSLRLAVENHPGSDLLDEARYWYGRALLAAGQTENAITVLEDLAQSNSDYRRGAEIAVVLAEAHQRQGKTDRAVRWLITALPAYDKDGEKYEEIKRRVQQYILQGEDPREIAALVRRYDTGFPGGIARYRHVELLAAAGDFDAAQEAGKEFLAKLPDHPLHALVERRLRIIESARNVDPLRIGVILPLSGKYKVFGERALRGIELAQQNIHVRGRGKGAKVTFIYRDSGGDPDKAVQAVEELALEENVIGIIGPLLGITAAPAARRAEVLEVPIMTMSQREGLPEIGPYVFRYFMTPRDQARALVRYAIKHRAVRNFGIMYPETALGRNFMMTIWKEVEDAGGWVTAADSYEAGATDFKAPLTRMTGRYYADAREYDRKVRKERAGRAWRDDAIAHIEYSYWKRFHAPKEGEEPDPNAPEAPEWPPREKTWQASVDFDAIFLPDAWNEVVLIAPQLDYNDVLGVEMLGTSAWNDPQLPEKGEKYVEGSVFVDAFFANSIRPRVARFAYAYEQAFGEQATVLEATAHDAASMMGKLLGSRQPPLRRNQLKDALLGVDGMNLLLGKASISETGDAVLPLTLLTVAEDEIVELVLPEEDPLDDLEDSEAPKTAPAEVQ
ncbi:MAG: ABC transporter substrate-binding protein [Chrysiogenetes bacterium]|nr:ABC transporter substrate-binding protein [Chrysiogenetes bacterium]